MPPFARDALADDDGALTREQRAELLRTHRAIVATLAALGPEIDRASDAERGTLVDRELQLFQREADLREIYLASLRPIPISRCPLTGELLWRSIDTADLDGLWWRAEAAVRPFAVPPRTFVALSGAMRLGQPIAPAPFLAKPGPAAPFVIPRLLRDGKAVISTVAVGPHTGYAIAYFSEHPERFERRVNEWGGDGYALVADGAWSWESWAEQDDERDFALRPWLERGSLLWIAPEDASLATRSGVAGCPYVDLPGTHQTQRVEDGVVR